MKKTFLLSFCAINILLAWCENYNNFNTYDEQTAWCEKWILSHWSDNADFERKWSETTWDKTVINWIKYEWKSKQEIKCEFNENGKLVWIKSSTLVK